MKKNYVLLLLLACCNSFRAIIYVNKNATGSNNGFSWTNAYTTLELAFSNSVVGDQIWVAQGVYKPTGTSRSTTFSIPNGVAVYGSFAGTETAVSQRDLTNGVTTTLNGDINSVGVQTDNCYNVVKFTNVSSLTIFDGFKIINGYNNTSTYGGAIYNSGGQPTIRNCEMIANYAFNGGAFGNSTQESNVTTLISCKIRNNSAIEGGAVFNNSGTLKLIDCDITSNTASYGGAIHVEFDNVIVDRTIFSGNSSSNNGGVVYVDNTGSSIEFYNSLLVGNFAPEKSVMGMNSPVSNTDVSKFVNCTIVNNRNTGTSPNSSFIVVLPYNNGSTMHNCIFTNNISPRVLLNGNVSNCIIDATIAANNSVNVTSVAPSFVAAHIPEAAPFEHDNYNYRLVTGSAGINGGSNALVSPLYTMDLSKGPRIANTTVDIGAYEVAALAVDTNTMRQVYCYPNPTSGAVFINGGEMNTEYTVTNSLGATLHRGVINSDNQSIDLNGYSAGLYFVKLSNGVSQKIIKK